MERADKGKKVRDVLTVSTVNKLLDNLNKPADQRKKPSTEFQYLRAKAQSGEFPPYEPVSLVGEEMKVGQDRYPILIASTLQEDTPWGVVQSKCTTKFPAEIITHGVSWCNVEVNSEDDRYLTIGPGGAETTDTLEGAIAYILFGNIDGPSLIQFPLSQGGGGTEGERYRVYATADFDALDAIIPVQVSTVYSGTLYTVGSSFNLANPLWKNGDPSTRAYAGTTGTFFEVDIIGTEQRILEMTCTIVCCSEEAGGGGPEPI